MSELRHAIFTTVLMATLMVDGQKASDNDSVLRDYLKQNPHADYDEDGILTQTEAQKHKRMQVFIESQSTLLEGMPDRVLADYSYGPHWRNVLDFWKAQSDQPSPVLIFFHPGGFVGGDKSVYYGNPLVLACLESGISVVLANYRYATQAPFPGSHLDAARVVQTVRHHAESWGIDPARVAMTGSSAGGNMSVWLAVHDDLADPHSDDPVLRQSTRLSTIIGVNPQTSNDPFFIWDKIYAGQDAHSSTFAFFGIPEMEIESLKQLLQKSKYRKIATEASALNHISPDDPPVFLIHPESLQEWDGNPLPPGTAQSKYAHHIAFGKYFKDDYDALGLICKLRGKDETSVKEQIEWLRHWFGQD